jgi:hypothetical protein
MGNIELDATEKNLVIDYVPSIHNSLGSTTQKKRVQEKTQSNFLSALSLFA